MKHRNRRRPLMIELEGITLNEDAPVTKKLSPRARKKLAKHAPQQPLTKADPSRTLSMRKAFEAMLSRQFDLLKERIVQHIFLTDLLSLNRDVRADIHLAVQRADADPTEAQRSAGNYRHGHVVVQGIHVTIETAKGIKRQPHHDKPVAAHYGYVKRTESEADGDHVDVFIGPHPDSELVWIVDQNKGDGSFDEHKTFIGFRSEEAALQAYRDSYPDDWQGFAGITELTVGQFKRWLRDGDTSRPVTGQTINSAEPDPELTQERELVRIAEAASKQKDSPDYGQLFLNPETQEVWYVSADGDDRMDWLEEELAAVPLVRKVTVEAEGFPPGDGSCTQLWPRARRWETRNANPNHDELGRFADGGGHPMVTATLPKGGRAWAKKLSEDERFAVEDWIEDQSEIKAHFTKGEANDRDADFIKALQKAPVVIGQVYRGISLTQEALAKFLSTMKEGSLTSDAAPFSMTRSLDKTSRFTSSLFGQKRGVLLVIQSKTGRSIEGIFEDQQEVVSLPGTQYRVKKVDSGASGSRIPTIHMEEVETSTHNVSSQETYQPLICNGQVGWFPVGNAMCRGSFGQPLMLVEVPDVRQDDSSSCGAAAAMSVGRHFGVGPDTLAGWKELLGTDRDGTDSKRIWSSLKGLGLRCVPRDGMMLDDLSAAQEAGSPVLVPMQAWGTERQQDGDRSGHWSVVIGRGMGHVFLQDPSASNVLKEGVENSNPDGCNQHTGPGCGDSGRWEQPKSESEAADRFKSVTDIHGGKSTKIGQNGYMLNLPGDRYIKVSLGKQWEDEEDNVGFKAYTARIDFGISGKESKFSAKELQPGTIELMRKLEQLAHAYHHAGFKLALAAADDRRKKFYAKAMERAGFKNEGEHRGEQIWNASSPHAPGRVMMTEADFLDSWHDVGGDGTPHIRFGIAVSGGIRNANPNHDEAGKFAAGDASKQADSSHAAVIRAKLGAARQRLRDFQARLDKATDVPVVKQIKAASAFLKDKTKQLCGKLEGRYGRTAAVAIMLSGQGIGWGALGAGAMLGVPLWLPGSSLWGAIPAVAMAEVGLQAYRGAKKLKEKLTKNEAVDIDAEAHQAAEQVHRHLFGWLEEHEITANANPEGCNQYKPCGGGDSSEREFKSIGTVKLGGQDVHVHYDPEVVSEEVAEKVHGWLSKIPAAERAKSVARRIEVFENPEDMHRRMAEVGIDPGIEESGSVHGAMDLGSKTLYTSTWDGHEHYPRTTYHEIGHSILGMDENRAEGWAQSHLPLVVNSSLQETSNAYVTNAHVDSLEAFQRWLKRQLGELVRGKSQEELWDTYIHRGFQKGAGRSFDDVRKPYARWYSAADKAAGAGAREEFLRGAFGQPEAREKVQLLAARAFDELENITEDMSNKMSRVLTDGLIEGKHPSEVARGMTDEVDISLHRAKVVARTELIKVHASGQLVALKRLGADEVGVEVEWTTSGLDSVDKKGNMLSPCERCSELQGLVLSLDEAEGLIPLHPGCVCCFVPAGLGEDDSEQVRKRKDKAKALEAAGLDPDEVLNFDEELVERDALGRFSSHGGSAAGHLFSDRPGHGGASSHAEKVEQQQPSEKAQRAKAAHVLVDKDIQRYAEEHNEPRMAKLLGGKSLPDSEPKDIETEKHLIELKTMVSNTNGKITMDSYSQVRKIVDEKETGKAFHTIISDDSAVYNANGEGKHGDDANRVYYYRRGVAGSARIQSMHRCENEAELKKLMETEEQDLPEAAKRTDNKLRVGKWTAFKNEEGRKGFRNSKTKQEFFAKK